MVADKENAGKLNFSGSKSFCLAALRLMAANVKNKRQRKVKRKPESPKYP